MGIKFYCPSCDKRLNVKSFLAGKGGFCPQCHAKIQIPEQSEPKRPKSADAGGSTVLHQPGHAVEAAASAPGGGTAHRNGDGYSYAPVTGAGYPGGAGTSPASGPQSIASAQFAPVTPSAPGAHPAPQGGYAAPYPTPQTPGVPAAGQPAMGAPVAGYGAYGGAPQPAMAAPVSAPRAPVAPVAPVAAVMPGPAMVDPIAEAPQAVWYVRPPAGGQYGPALGEVLRKWMAEGRVSADSLVWREGWPDWRKAAKVFPSLGAATAPVSPTAPAAAVGPLPGAPASAAPTTTRRTARPPRKRDSATFAIAAIVFLVLASIALLGGLLWVLGIV